MSQIQTQMGFDSKAQDRIVLVIPQLKIEHALLKSVYFSLSSKTNRKTSKILFLLLFSFFSLASFCLCLNAVKLVHSPSKRKTQKKKTEMMLHNIKSKLN